MDYYKDILRVNLEKYVLIKDKVLREAVLYSLSSGGKRLRPVLTLAACHSVGGRLQKALPFACAIEMIHTYSLIHDDLPAMDDDNMRRGRPTNHIVHGEAIAILAGDSLLNGAYETMANYCLKRPLPKNIVAMATIAKAAGIMVEGQAKDITGVTTACELLQTQRQKTAALICAAVSAGAIVGGAMPKQVKYIAKAGACLGLAFQIKDDYIEETQTEQVLGKTKSDKKNNKNTYVTTFGKEKSREDMYILGNRALALLNKAGLKDRNLQKIFENILKL
ncbi:MAG: polyprenyl synthetase family protein [Defluviitaleaceae bacterium]|nr:polyprenyl synthetase family protein [Defluviitaleaceae bacterium]